jgi:hypothetical protein
MLDVAARSRYHGDRPEREIAHTDEAARTWSRYVTAPYASQEVFESAAFQRQYIEIRYEDVVLDPERTLRQLAAQLGVSFHPNMLSPESFSHASIVDNRWYTREMLEAPIHDESIGRWQGNLTLLQRAVVAHYCQIQLQSFGYERDRKWISASNASRPVNIAGDLWVGLRMLRRLLGTGISLGHSWITGR